MVTYRNSSVLEFSVLCDQCFRNLQSYTSRTYHMVHNCEAVRASGLVFPDYGLIFGVNWFVGLANPTHAAVRTSVSFWRKYWILWWSFHLLKLIDGNSSVVKQCTSYGCNFMALPNLVETSTLSFLCIWQHLHRIMREFRNHRSKTW